MNKILALFLASGSAIAANNPEEPPVFELDETVVSVPFALKAAESDKPMTVLSGEKLRTKISGTLGETLKNELGITSQSFGSGVGTPVIRGQAGSRVKVMQNSIGNNDVSSLSPDHANSVEPLLAERIEVLRGTASLLYGSGATGGIVNVIDNRIPETMPTKIIGGALEQRYDSVNNETASVLKVEGGYKGLAYHLDGFYRSHGNSRIAGQAIDEPAARATDPTLADLPALVNSQGTVKDTSGWSRGGSAGASYIGTTGFVGLSINRLLNYYGIPADGSGALPVSIYLKQTKYTLKGQLNQPVAFAKTLRYSAGYTDYRHTELDNGLPASTFLNDSFENRLELEQQPLAGWEGKLGFQSTHSHFAALGTEAILPHAKQANYALFFSEAFTTGAVRYEMGGRGEIQTIHTETGRHFDHIPLSGSLSAAWQITPKQQLSLAFTHTQRAPALQELASNGVHAATRSYEIGNAGLGKEYSNNLDLRYHYQGAWLTAELSLFQNWASDYIYQQRSGDVFNTELGVRETVCSTASAACLPIEQSQQGKAVFRGFETKLTAPLFQQTNSQLDLTLFADYTRGYFTHGANVPRMPPLRYGLQLDYTYKDLSSNLRLTRAEAQHHSSVNDAKTPGYMQLAMGAAYQIAQFHNSNVLLFINGKNLLNQTVRNSTSYLRYFAPEAGRSVDLGIRISY